MDPKPNPFTETLDYQEYTEQQYQDTGHKVNQTIVEDKHINGPNQHNQSIEFTKQIDQKENQNSSKVGWKEKHPELYQEMVDNNVPLNPEEFKKKGYKFGKNRDEKAFVYYPTPEYSEWLARDGSIKEMPWPQRETLKEREARIKEEQEERREQLEQEKRQTTLEKRRETIYRNGLKNLNIEEQAVGDLCKDMFPEFDLSEAEKRDAVLLASRWLNKRRNVLEQDNNGADIYRRVCVSQMAEQISSNSSNFEEVSLNQYTNTYCNYLDTEYAIHNTQERGKPKYSSRSVDVAQRILADNQRDLLAKEFEETFGSLKPDEKRQEEKEALRSLISVGFMGQDIEDKSHSIKSLFERVGLSKDDAYISPEVIVGCTSIRLSGESHALAREKFAEFFGLDDRVCEMLDRREYCGLRKLGYPNNLTFSWRGAQRVLPRELTPKASAKADKYLDDIIDKISHDEGFLKAEKELLKSKIAISERIIRRDLYFWSSEWDTNDYNFSKALERSKIYPDTNKEMRQIAKDIAFKSGHMEILAKAEKETLAFNASHTYSVSDHRDVVREALMTRLSEGVEKWEERRYVRDRYGDDAHWDKYAGGRWHLELPSDIERYVRRIESSRKTRYLTDIFETNSFKENQERIGLDFADPEVFDAAFSGFIQTIETTNEESLKQANWYSDNIFVHNPEEFLSRLKAYRESEECSKGAKTRINKFLAQDKMVAEFYRRQQLEQVSEMMTGQIKIGNIGEQFIGPTKTTEDEVETIITSQTSVLQKANQNDILSLIRRRQEELITAIEGMGAEKVKTFPLAKEFPTERSKTEHNIDGQSGQRTPINFGIEKIEAEMKYYNFVKENIPNSNPQWFVDSFPGESRTVENAENRFDGVKLDSSRSYIGFSFNYGGKLCVVSESFGDPAAMYLFCGEPGSNFKRMFDMSKLDARMDANVATVNHLDRQHIDEDLDTSYQRAFMFFRTSNKNSVYYGSMGARSEWEARQDELFPAWPLGVTENDSEYSDDIERYRTWQANQMDTRPNNEA